MSGRFATLDSLKKASERGGGAGESKGGGGGGNESDDEGKGQDYYVGGHSARGGGSGLSVIGPPQGGGGDRDGDLVSGIFQRARGGPGPSSGGATVGGGGGGEGEAPPPGVPMRTITMYRNGFVVDDGPFRALDDPANEPFLRDMARGIVPKELEEGAQGQAVHVNLKDKREEEYQAPPPPSYIAYSGEGKTAGKKEISADAVVSGGSGPGDLPDVDEGKPTTNLQIILHNGKRVQRKFNLSNTIQHVQAFIASEGAGGAPYRLLEGFPPKELTDFTRTLEEAGLKNARITQKLV